MEHGNATVALPLPPTLPPFGSVGDAVGSGVEDAVEDVVEDTLAFKGTVGGAIGGSVGGAVGGEAEKNSVVGIVSFGKNVKNSASEILGFSNRSVTMYV